MTAHARAWLSGAPRWCDIMLDATGTDDARMSRRLFTLKQIEQALRKSAGIQARAAELLEEATGIKCSRKVINDAVRRHPELQQASLEAEEETLDLAESVVVKHLHGGDLNAARFFLETKGKHRGYSRRVQQLLSLDPRRLSDHELDRALQELEATARTLNLEPLDPPPQPALPALANKR